MAYAAVSSVLFAIRGLVYSPRISVASSTREILQSATDHARWLRETLSFCGQVVTASDEREIIEESRGLEDAIEFAASAQFLQQTESGESTFSLNLDHLTQHVHRFARAAVKMKQSIEVLWEKKVAKMIEQHIVEICLPPKQEEEDEEEDDDGVSSSATDMIGLSDEFQALRDAIDEHSCSNRITSFLHSVVFWISGMAGVGKTTLAKRIFHDPLVKASFECLAFVRVGREYRVERVLQAVLAQLSCGDENIMKEGDDEEGDDEDEEGDDEDAYESFRRALRVKRCLVVLDDVWYNNVLLDLVKRNRNIECMGSCILVTSRMEAVFPYKSRSWKMRFLTEEESWELLKKKVFDEEEEECPPLLVKPGKKIAEKCEGLPLLIIAVANELRSKVQKNLECWNRVAEKPNSVLEEASNQISEVLLPSYNQLDEIYKVFFLYIAVFPRSYQVFCSKIINLWHAEGFQDFVSQFTQDTDKSHAFRELLQNNLVIMGHHKSWSSHNIKACSLHSAYWYLCKRVAKDNRFLYIMNSYADGMDECVESHHRLAIQTNVLFAIKEVRDNIASISTVRSVLCTGPYNQYQVPICYEWKLLRVLDALTIRFYEFPEEVVELILLRYLALTCNGKLPRSISKLWSLQFLIVRQHLSIKRVAAESYVPVEIWNLQELIHLEIMGRNLPNPPHPGLVLPKLTKLLDVGVESCTREVLDCIPSLKKLRIQIELAPDASETLMCIDHIPLFYNLQSFQGVITNPTLLRPPPPLAIPIVGLRKLSLSGFGYPWEEMSKIAKLPNLSVLKLRCYAFRGERWEANEEMRFSSLRYLYIEDTDLVQWTSEDENFQYLWGLTMKNCHKLHEIPRILSFSMNIELVDCNPLAEACGKQRYGTATEASFTASYSWNEKKLKSWT